MDRKNLYQMITGTWPETSSSVVDLPPWTVVIVLTGPKGEVDYQREDMLEIAARNEMKPMNDLPGIPDAGRKILEELRIPKGFYQSEKYSYHPLQFYISSRFIPAVYETFQSLLAKYDYAQDRIGYTLVPVEKGRVYYCEFGIHSVREDKDDFAKTKEMYIDAVKTLLDTGAFFSRPYGPVEELVYARAGAYHGLVKKIKGMLDPNNIMNTGRIC